MSGIVGIVHLDGSSVDHQLVQKLTDFLTFRGPDGRHTRAQDNVGFGHALFKTTGECERDSQPLTLNGKTWIVADARIDARAELLAQLKAAGQREIASPGLTDAELVLRAYEVWGENCVEHLLGDFAFGIWDDYRQQLFCARDHMGVKPFYYAQMGSTVIFSNTLECVREHPAVSNQLNDLAIADFLLFGINQNSARTCFAEIHRIPPAHCGTWSRARSRIRRYWSMPVEDPLFYRRAEDYIDHFHDLLHKCIGDRLRTNRVSVFMSGGIDSPTLAATAREILRQRYGNFELRALTRVDGSLPEEREYAGIVADYLRIPIDYWYWDDLRFDRESAPFGLPEPFPDAYMLLAERQSWAERENYARVFLYGEGPDNALLLDWQPYLRYVMRQGRYGWLARGGLATIMAAKRPPFWGRISRILRVGRNSDDDLRPPYPGWLSPAFENRLQLRNRWHDLHSPRRSLHPIRPKAYASLQISLWQFLFERFDPGVSRHPFEVRYPYVDVRMLRFMLAVPPLPWCRSKYLIRKSMAGRLPKAILDRRKATIHVQDARNFLSRFCEAPFTASPELCKFVDPLQVDRLAPDDMESKLRIYSLNHWLQSSYRRLHTAAESYS